MAVAQRPEPPPAAGYMNFVSFGDALWALTEDDMEDIPCTVKLAYASVEGAFAYPGATMVDVARVLLECRPHLPAHVLTLRSEAMAKAGGSTLEVLGQIQQQSKRLPARQMVPTTSYRDRPLPIRNLRVNDSGLRAPDLQELCCLVCGHGTLATISLQGNEFLVGSAHRNMPLRRPDGPSLACSPDRLA